MFILPITLINKRINEEYVWICIVKLSSYIQLILLFVDESPPPPPPAVDNLRGSLFPGLPSPLSSSSYNNLCLRSGFFPGLLPHHNGLPLPHTTFPSTASALPPPLPASASPVTAGYPPHIPPFYLYAHAQKALQLQQSQSGLAGNGLLEPESMRQAGPSLNPSSPGRGNERQQEDIKKETILNNSIENLRMRARQHAAAMGYAD